MPVMTEQKFGIVSDILGVDTSVPKIRLNKAFSPESENVYLRYGECRRMPGRSDEFVDGSDVKVQTPDGYEIIRYHKHLTQDGTEYVFAATKAHIYRWRQATTDYLTQHTCASDCDLWDFISFNQKVIATNNVDKVLVWDESTPATDFAPLGSASGLDLDGGATYLTKAKYVTTYENYVIFGYTTEGGIAYPFRERWCSYGDETDYDESGTGDTGAKDFLEGSDPLMGFGKYDANHANLLIVFKKHQNFPQWLVEGDSVFETIRGSKVGLLARHAIENDKEGYLYFLASDYTIRKYKHGIISKRIDKSLRQISPTYEADICATFIDTFNQIWWSIPGAASSTNLDKIAAYDIAEKVWNIHSFSIRAFGRYSRQSSYTIDGLDALAGTIDDLDAAMSSIDAVELITGFELDLASDTSGYTYNLHDSETDAGASYIGKLVLGTDLADKRALAWYKRVSNIQLVFNGEGESGFTVDVSAKEDRGNSWESLDSVSLNSSGDEVRIDVPCDLRFHYGEIKLEASNKFEFLGAFFDFEWDGDR
jgi:hypothetical protein